MYYEQYLTALAKTEPPITLMEHSSDVLQVANYLIERNAAAARQVDVVRAAALMHDVGKIKNDRRAGQWIHAPHSSIYLGPLLDDEHFQPLLCEAGIDTASLDRELVLLICEEHHNPSPKLLRRFKDAILVSVADALASSIGSGTVGSIVEVLRSNPYMQVNLELVRSLGFDNGLDSELHHIDLPGQFTEDLLLADMIFRVMDKPLRDAGITPLLQKGPSLWMVGALDSIRAALCDLTVHVKQLYDTVFDEGIYDAVLGQFPSGAMQIDILRFLLVNEPIARKMAIALYTRDKPRKLFEKYNLSHLADIANEVFANGLKDGIDALWSSVRLKLLELAPTLDLPLTLAADVEIAASNEKRRERALFVKPKAEESKSRKTHRVSPRAKHNCEVLKAMQKQDKNAAEDVEEFLKLFDYSQNSYRSLTNILLELIKMQTDIESGAFSLCLDRVALLDGQPFTKTTATPNAGLCPVCRRFEHETKAPSLITGRSEGDSVYYMSRQRREGAIKICQWCFIAGYMDLPIANIIHKGNSVIKGRGYLLLTSPQPRDKLQRLVDFVRCGRDPSTDVEQGGDRDEESKLDLAEVAELEAMMAIGSGYDELAVLGRSRRRLSNLKGFVLPTANVLGNMAGIRIPFEGLVGEDKVSGAVRRELVKATMYDLYLVTGAPMMHYNLLTDAAFSVDGQPITLEEMQRSNMAYRIASRYARVGRYRQLNSGIFMLLLRDPRQAITSILRTRRRENHGQYVPGEDRIKELIEMAETIACEDWKFNLGLKIVGTLVEVGLTPKARGFRFGPNPREVFSGVELVKWLQRLKMVRDETSARAWGTMLINALKRGDLAYKEYIKDKGGQISAPGEETVKKIIDLVEEVITTCTEHSYKLSEFSRDVAGMDYYLLFYYNQKAKEPKQ